MSDLLTRLIAAGTAPDLVAEVAMLLAEKKLAAEAIDARRASDRARQGRRRGGNKAEPAQDGHVMSRDVTLDNVTERDPSISLPLSSPHTPQQTPTHTHPDNNTRARKGGCAKPDDVSQAVWDDFCGLRKVRRAPVTANVVTSIRAEAGKAGLTLEAALTECVARGWQSFKADWGAKPAAPPGDYLASLPARRPQPAGP